MDQKQFSEFEKSINLAAKMHDLKDLDQELTFFYDETNNVRKLHIKENNKLNVVALADFVLGGIVRMPGSSNLELESLRSNLGLDAGIRDLKLRHFAKREFPELICSEKLTGFLQWVIDQNLLIHQSHLDPLYWSIVDIVDSILLQFPDLLGVHSNLKSDLTELLKHDVEGLIAILARYEYPDVKPEHTRSFSEDILGQIHRYRKVILPFNFEMIEGLLQMARNLETLEFIEGNTPRKLIETFEIFYFSRMLTFRNSHHIFDNEPVIAEALAAKEWIAEKFKSKYEFVSSDQNVGIQISDVLVGLLGKLYTYVRYTKREEILRLRETKDETARKNMFLLRTIVIESEKVNKAFIHHVASLYDLEKLSLLFG